MRDFPVVARDQAVRFLELAKDPLVDSFGIVIVHVRRDRMEYYRPLFLGAFAQAKWFTSA